MPHYRQLMFLGLISLCCFSLLGSAYGFEGSFDQSITLDSKLLAQFRVTAKDDKVRMEILNGQEPEFMIESSEGHFRIYPNKKIAIQLPLVNRHTFLDDLDNFDEYLKTNQGQKKSEETLNEKETEVYEYTDPNFKQKGQAWIVKDSRLPLRIEIPTPQGTVKVEFSNYNMTDKVDDSAFTVPVDVKVISHEQTMAENTEAANAASAAAAKTPQS